MELFFNRVYENALRKIAKFIPKIQKVRQVFFLYEF